MNVKQFLATNPRVSKTKWGNQITDYNGKKYHSKKEADFARQLDFLKKAKDKKDRVVEWTPQVSYPIVVNGHKICTYILDFKVLYADGRIEYIDTKPFDKRKSKFLTTDTYKLKKKLMLACHGIEIIEH